MSNRGSLSLRHLREGEEPPVNKDLRRRFKYHECGETYSTIEIVNHPEVTDLKVWGCHYCIRIFISEVVALAEQTPKLSWCIGTNFKASAVSEALKGEKGEERGQST